MAEIAESCSGCGGALPLQRRPRNPRKWCSEACRVKAYRAKSPAYVERQAVLARERRAAAEAMKPPRPQCLNCGKEMARRADAAYCDAQPCRTAKYQARQASRPRCAIDGCEYPVIARGLCGSHYSVEWRLENLERSRDTARRRRALRRRVRVESFSSREVFDRDGWVCGICSEPIPRDAVWPDLRSPSIDHVVPIARGGEHSLANVQAAHLSCNSRKQDRVSA